MFADEEKKSKTNLDDERDYYDGYFAEVEEQEAQEKAGKKSTKKVIIAEPEEPKKFEWSLKNITVMTALLAIALYVVAKLFNIIGVAVCYAIFYYLGAVALLGALGCYVTQVIKNHELKFEPQLVILLLSVFVVLA